ncbi:MAG: hypothetical protein HGB12_12845 [Bacteroidetes bacterium]|nr:hypothetical protein [Bacteroidota bacterium]
MATSNTCFVIMPIGDQIVNGETISYSLLKQRYDDLIKEAINKAAPGLEVVRADEVALSGTITSDILTRIMHSDIVIADVTYPNPNVFYELGLRHACKPGTIIIKDKNGPKVPFDIAHLRNIEYENTPTGLKELSENLKRYIEHFANNPSHPDNHLLELAKLTGYRFQEYGKEEYDPEEDKISAFLSVMKHPELMEILMKKGSGEDIDNSVMLQSLMKYPDVAGTLFKTMVRSGEISLGGTTQRSKPKALGIKKNKKRR